MQYPLCRHRDFQRAALRFPLVHVLARDSTPAFPSPLTARPTMESAPPWSDCVESICGLARKFQYAGQELARALASVQGLRPARERKSTGALGPSRGTSGRSLQGRDLSSGSTAAVAVARFPKPAGPFRRWFLRQKVDD